VYRFVEGQVGYELVGGISLYAAHVKALAVDSDSRLYALTNSGLFVNTGAAWQKIESLPEVPISLAIAPSDPQRLYAGSAFAGAYRSTDGGQTWAHIGHELGMTPGAMLRVTALAVDRQDPDHVVAATAYGLGRQLAPAGIYESLTAGQNWVKIADTDSLVEQLTLNKGAVIATTKNGLARYGQAVEVTEAAPSFTALHSLARPTGVQALILVLTVGLAGLALLAQPEWVLRLRRASITVK
jgi:hypothetical protein